MKARFMELAFLAKLEKANPNASRTVGTLTELKKTTDIDGSQRIFVSGASVKYAIKQYLYETGWTKSTIAPKITRKIKAAAKKSKTENSESQDEAAVERQISTECDPQKFIEDDLFGYMDTSRNIKRTAPVKTNGMIALFPYPGDLNRGVRYDPQGEEHSLYDIEVVTSVFRSNWAVELDRVGVSDDPKEGPKFDLEATDKEKRVKALLEAIFHFWSRVKQTNFLSGMGPEVVVMVMRDDKSLAISDKLRINTEYNLDTVSLIDALNLHKSRIKECYLGYSPSFVKNAEALLNSSKNFPRMNVMHLAELCEKVLSDDFRIYT